jgi:hypothetical protein
VVPAIEADELEAPPTRSVHSDTPKHLEEGASVQMLPGP